MCLLTLTKMVVAFSGSGGAEWAFAGLVDGSLGKGGWIAVDRFLCLFEDVRGGEGAVRVDWGESGRTS